MPGTRSTPQIALYSALALVLMACGKDPAAPAPAASAPVSIAAQPPSKSKPPPFPFVQPVPMAPPRDGTKIDPASLRTFLLRDDISVVESLNNVYKANEQIAAAHAALLPSVSIAPILSGGTFGFGGVSFLLPFLAPSNWYNLDATKHQLAASGYAYYLVELNEYASAYTLYLSMLADEEIEQNQQIHYGNSDQIRKFVESQVKLGLANKASLQQATAQTQLAHVALMDLDNTINVERASVRKVLGFELNRKFFLDETHLPELSEESISPQALLDRTYERSPEELQVVSLLAAAKDATWSNAFSFLGGSAPELNLAYGGNPFSVVGTGSFGFGIFPQVQLGHLAERDLELRRRQIYLEESKAIETTLISLQTAKDQLTDALEAEKNARDAYSFIQDAFAHDKASLNDVTSASELVIGAAVTRVGVRLKVDTQRVNLERILLSREFSPIPNCHLDRTSPQGGAFGWLERIFDPGRVRVTVDDLCRARR